MADESDFQLQNSLQAIEYGKECVKAGILINGGAAVALLGLLGGGKATYDVDGLRASLTAFCAGVIMAFIAAMIGYAAQTFFAINNSIRSSGKSEGTCVPVIVSFFGVLFVFGSIGMFCWGIYTAGQAIFTEQCSAGLIACAVRDLINATK